MLSFVEKNEEKEITQNKTCIGTFVPRQPPIGRIIF